MTNRLLVHNGNRTIKPWFAAKHNLFEVPNISDVWTFDGCQEIVDDKISFVEKHKNTITDITPADTVNVVDLIKIKKHFEIFKVISDYEFDCKNLDHDQTNYNQSLWTEALFYRLSITDNLVWWNTVAFPSTTQEESIVFTPGRSGTHLLIDLIMLKDNPTCNNVRKYFLHHDDHLIHRPDFQKLVNSKHIYSSLRRSLVKQTLSSAVIKQTGVIMLNSEEDDEQNKKIVAQWGKLTFSEQDCHDTLMAIMNYADILLGLRHFYHKNISFSVFEDLSHHYNHTVKYIKNPWEYKDLFENYDYAVSYCEQYQTFYQSIIDRISQTVGTSLHNNY